MRKKMTEKEKKDKRARAGRLKAARKERRDELFEGDPISHMEEISAMQDKLRTYYYWGSELWTAIKDHIANAKDCALFDLEGTIISYRGTGPSISIGKTMSHKGHDIFWMAIEVEYFCDGKVGSYDPATYTKTYDVRPPCELERNFTKKGFNAWLAKVKEERDVVRDAKDIAQYKRLRKKLKGRVIDGMS